MNRKIATLTAGLALMTAVEHFWYTEMADALEELKFRRRDATIAPA